MNVERLMRSDLSALAMRSAQEARKWLERAHLAGWGDASGAPMPAEIVRAAAAVRLAPKGPRGDRFFRGVLGSGAALVAASVPEALRQASAVFEKSRAGQFDLLGYRALAFGVPIDWQLDPVSGQRAPALHWSLIRPLDPAQVGDSKVICELNRCQWWVTLARAFAMGGDPAIPPALAAHALRWREANPPGQGVNWSSSLEVSLRLISFCWTAFLLRAESALPTTALEALLHEVRSHARHVARYLSRQFSPNTHLTGEALGLFYAGTALPELEEAAGWRETGAQILIEQIDAQILSDGVYFEQATAYQRYTIEIYLHFLILAAASGFPLPARVGEVVVRMLDFLLFVRRPDGTLPSIGDADGGWLLPLTERGPADLRGVFSTAAAWFSRADYAWAAEGLAPETLWLLGEEGHDAFRALAPAPPASAPSRLFVEGGYAVMRSDWPREAHQLIFDCGPLGCPVSSGHGHADLLSIQCSIFGEPVLVDPGTCVYPEPVWRNRMRASSAHSTITLDGQEQAEPAGPFRWKQHPSAQPLRWSVTPSLELAMGSHEAYRRLPDPVRHQRQVLFVERHFWIVIDDLEGAAEHRVDLRFQLAPMQVRQEPGGDGWVRALTPGGRALLVRTFATCPLELAIHTGEMEPPRGWISLDYGQLQPAPLLVYTGRAPLPMRIVTLLFPLARADAPPPLVTAIRTGGQPVGLSFGDGPLVHFGGAGSALASATTPLERS